MPGTPCDAQYNIAKACDFIHEVSYYKYLGYPGFFVPLCGASGDAEREQVGVWRCCLHRRANEGAWPHIVSPPCTARGISEYDHVF